MKNFNILIIEDESLIALRIKRFLENNGYQVVGIAKDSSAAIEYIHNHNVNLIIADITISGELNGIETIEIIQKNFDIPVIFLTSHQEDKFLKQAAKVNYKGFIVKPFIEEELIREVKLVFYYHCNIYDDNTLVLLSSNYVYDIQNQIIQKDSVNIVLAKYEKFFLHTLVLNRNQIVSNEQIDLLLWHDKPVEDTNRRQLLFRLRKKLPELNIETIKGQGYKLIV
jgi:DNA-binding response OmpR family regulator